MAVEVLGRKQAGHTLQTQYLGVVLPPAEAKYVRTLAVHKSISLALATYLQTRFDLLECHMSPDLMDLQAFDWAGYTVSVRYASRVDLANLDQAWRNMDDKRRNDIRKAQRAGITVDAGASMVETLGLVENAYRRSGIEVKFRELALKRDQSLRARNQSRCFIARNKAGEALAAVYLVWDARTSYYLLGGFDPEKSQRGAAALAIWTAMRFSGEVLKLERFDLLAGHLRLHDRFFRGFGGRLTPRFSVQWARPSLKRDAVRVMGRIKAMLGWQMAARRTE